MSEQFKIAVEFGDDIEIASLLNHNRFVFSATGIHRSPGRYGMAIVLVDALDVASRPNAAECQLEMEKLGVLSRNAVQVTIIIGRHD